jgi:hypothetical protein
MFESKRYAINYVNDCLLKDSMNPPDKEQSDKDYDALKALFETHKSDGREGARKAWKVLRKAVPHLDKPKKLWNIHELQYLDPPQYALPFSENGEAPFYAIYLKGLNVIYGKPGSGKTFIALDFVNRVSLAHPDNAVVFTAGEGVSGLRPRQMAWEQHYKQHVSNLHVYDEALPLLNPDSIEEFKFWAYDINPIFIVIDTLARAMLGENENDTAVMGKFIAQCDILMRDLDCGILLVHHTNRMGYLRGSIALDGGADSMLKIHAEDDVHIVYNSLDNGGKNKHSEEAPALYLRKLPVQLEGMKDSAVMVKSEKIIDEIEEGDALTDNQMKILRVMFGHEYMIINDIIEQSGVHRRTVYRNIKKLVDAEYIQAYGSDSYKLTDKATSILS